MTVYRDEEDRIFVQIKDLRLCLLDVKLYRSSKLLQNRTYYINIWLTTTTDFNHPDFTISYTPKEEDLFIKDIKTLDDYFKVKDSSEIKL